MPDPRTIPVRDTGGANRAAAVEALERGHCSTRGAGTECGAGMPEQGADGVGDTGRVVVRPIHLSQPVAWFTLDT
jgi:hypothetical protein